MLYYDTVHFFHARWIMIEQPMALPPTAALEILLTLQPLSDLPRF
jgi:hypothetical protein